MINKAISFATLAHEGQTRKGTNIPYIFHPLEVGYILAQATDEEKVICAGILHDTVEDAGVDLKTIEKMFSKKTRDLVSAQSEDKSLSWKERKQHTITYFKEHASEKEALICCADKLSNIRSIEKDISSFGEGLWKRFNAGYEEQKWYYEGLVSSLSRLSSYEMYKEFKERVQLVFNKER